MPFEPKKTKNKVTSVYKTLYISEALVKEVDRLAGESGTSFNNIVVSMIEYCLDENKQGD